MKAPILGLAVATAAFAGSSLYLWQQLGEERARAAQVEESARKLNARVAELEKARVDFTQRHMSGGFVAGPVGAGGPAAALPAAPPTEVKNEGAPDKPVWSVLRRTPPPAFQKMMRTQIRTSNKRLYADVGPKLGLDKDTASKLVDLLSDQQIANMEVARTAENPEEVERRTQRLAMENDQAISDLIGPDKALSLKEYQESIPARMEVEMVARQLEGNDTSLSAEQRQKLTDIYVAERARVPEPEYTEGTDGEEFNKAMNAWRDDYEKRIASEIGPVLTPEQLTAYNDIQQWQKEMREQMPQLPPGFRRGRGFAGGNSVMFSTAAPAGAISATIVNEKPAAPPKKP